MSSEEFTSISELKRLLAANCKIEKIPLPVFGILKTYSSKKDGRPRYCCSSSSLLLALWTQGTSESLYRF